MARELITVDARDIKPGDRGGFLGPHRKIVEVDTSRYGQVKLYMQWRNGRFERATIDNPTRKVRIERTIGGSGSALRFRTTSRITGTLVEVWDALVDGSPVGPDTEPVLDEDGAVVDLKVTRRWLTVCAPHGGTALHATMAAARDEAADPRAWCEVCEQDAA